MTNPTTPSASLAVEAAVQLLTDLSVPSMYPKLATLLPFLANSKAPTVEQVEEEVSMSHDAWDCINPTELIAAVLRLARPLEVAAPVSDARQLDLQAGFSCVEGQTLEKCASFLERKADAHADEFASTDPDTNSLEWGRGSHAQAKEDRYNELLELAQEIRSIERTYRAASHVPVAAGSGSDSSDLAVAETRGAPAPEPAAWRRRESGGWWVYYETKAHDDLEPLYATPAQAPAPAPLGGGEVTDERLWELRSQAKADPRTADQHWFILFARSVIAEVRIAQSPELRCWFRDCATVEACAETRCKTLATQPPMQQDAAPVAVEAWRSMDTAPKDGTMVRLLVDYSDAEAENPLEDAKQAQTIGANYDDNVAQSEALGWQFAGWDWQQDCFTHGVGRPIGWLPFTMPAAPTAAVQPGGQDSVYLGSGAGDRVQAPDAVEVIARKLYGGWIDNQGIHCNRFAGWSELDDSAKKMWRERAAILASEKATTGRAG